MSGRRFLSCLALLCASALAACAARAAPQPPAGASVTDHKMLHDGRERRYLVHDFSSGRPAPVVFVLHGGGGHPENARNMSQFDIIGAREKLIVVYPGGTGGMPGGRLLTWNAGHCCAYARENDVDDVGFFRKMIDELVASGRADPKRIFVTGMSNGGMMSHRLARELPSRIAAIAPVVGAIFGDEPPAMGPVAVMIIVGRDDQTVPEAGGPLGGPERRGMAANLARRPEDHDVAPALSQAEYWAWANGCGIAEAGADASGRFRWTHWDKCASRRPVQYYSIANNGHAWPGGKAGRAEADQPTPDVNASEMMWQFFAANPKF